MDDERDGRQEHEPPADARARVESEKAHVEDLIGRIKHELDDEADGHDSELSHYDQHPADAGTDTFEREKDLSILDGLEAELGELEAALERIDAGTYGIDEVTGEAIDVERLAANPAARTNLDADRGVPGLA